MVRRRQESRYTSTRALHRVIDRLAPEVSEQRLSHLRMTADMFDRALAQDALPAMARERAPRLFTEPVLRTVWGLAAAGELRARAEDVGRPLALASLRALRDSLGILAGEVVPGREVWLPSVPQQPPKDTTTSVQEAALFRHLVGRAAEGRWDDTVGGVGMSPAYRVRMLAIAAVALDTRSRAGELAGMRLEDLGEGDRSVRVWRRPQNAGHLEPVELVLPLREATARVLGLWRPVRAGLVSVLEGSDPGGLWVAVQTTGHGERLSMQGMPLSAPSIRRAYTRGVVGLNWVMAGSPGWEPLPLSLEALRRAAVVEEEAQLRAEEAAREAAERAAAREAAQAVRPRVELPPTSRHGTPGAYANHGCRCTPCSRAWAEYLAAYRASRAGRPAKGRRGRGGKPRSKKCG